MATVISFVAEVIYFISKRDAEEFMRYHSEEGGDACAEYHDYPDEGRVEKWEEYFVEVCEDNTLEEFISDNAGEYKFAVVISRPRNEVEVSGEEYEVVSYGEGSSYLTEVR